MLCSNRWTRPQLHSDWSTVTWPLSSLSLGGVSVRSFLTNQSTAGSKGSWVQNRPDKSLQTLVFERNTHTCECECLSLTHSTLQHMCHRRETSWSSLDRGLLLYTTHTQRENSSVPELHRQTSKTPGLLSCISVEHELSTAELPLNSHTDKPAQE